MEITQPELTIGEWTPKDERKELILTMTSKSSDSPDMFTTYARVALSSRLWRGGAPGIVRDAVHQEPN